MLSRHRVSRAAIELIKRFEGYRRHAAQLPDGRWMIGYGHTLTARAGAEVSEPDAEALLVYDLISVQHTVNENVFAPLSQNQFDALCSFAFNIGLDNFRRSQVLKRLNAGAAVQAACAMELWRKADFQGERIVVDTLVRRRAAEKALFLTPPGGDFAPAPSPIIRPIIDLDALDLVPLRRPVELETSFEDDKVTVRRETTLEEAGVVVPSPEPGPEPEPQPELMPEPFPAVTAAAEAVTARLETLFPDPGEEPPFETETLPEAAPEEMSPPQAETVESPDEAPMADEGAPIVVADPEPEAEPVADEVLDVSPEPESILDADLDIPRAPIADPVSLAETAPSDFIPARQRPAPRPREFSVMWDLLLALFGLAFFGFGIFWGLNWRAAPAGGMVTPLMVAWPAGVAGILFVVVAVFRLLQRLGREAEQD